MRLNHLHLMVPDVPAASGFFEKYFELRKISGNAGLTLMQIGSKSTKTYPASFHVGFFLDSDARVDAVRERTVADGFEVPAPKREHAYSFYVNAPGGFLVEVGA